MSNTVFVKSALAAAIIAAAPSLLAQPQIEEITITARKRDETNINVPVTDTVFTDQKIQDVGIEKPADFIALTPNVTLVQTQNAGNSFVTARGISQNRNTEMSVAVLMDGVLMVNPAQFNQELFDVQQIEVLKGPQGALYGRNAIGGAIVITTKEPGNTFEGNLRVGYDSGPGYKYQGTVSGPLTDTLKYRLAVSGKNTDGYIENTYLNQKADPYQDLSFRGRLLWEPSDDFRADLRYYSSQLKTQGFYYNIRSPLPEPFPGAPISLGHGQGDPNSVNDTSLDVRVNNAGVDDRNIHNLSLKMDWDYLGGVFTSITSWDSLDELITGDAFDFVPIPESIGVAFGYTNQNQSQYLETSSYSQEIRFTSDASEPLRWILGAYAVKTKRFISTGNMVDTGNGVFPVFRQPRGNFPYDFATDALNPQTTYLADSQNNFAWAIFGEWAYDVTDALEASFSLRYDKDTRKNTTETPTAFLPNVAGFPAGYTGELRKKTWDEWQPKFTLRYKTNENLSWYGSLSKGFRSGGFNQTGVGPIAAANGFAGVGDTFDAETVKTAEVGMKGRFFDNRMSADLSIYKSWAKGTYFFIYLAANSTQNLGNLNKVEYHGMEFDSSLVLNDYLNVDLGYGVTNSNITDSDNPSDINDAAPNVSHYTFNLGLDLHHPVQFFGDGVQAFTRVEYQRIGPTAFFDHEQPGTNNRNTVNLVDLRVGVELPDNWNVTGWIKNMTDKQYNTEYSTGGFVFKAEPRRWGVDFTKHF